MNTSERVGAYSIGVNTLLVGIKLVLSFLSGSIALVADAIHSLTDVISSLTVFMGIKLSRRKSQKFPYGLYKVENFVSLLSALFIFLAGYEIVHSAFFEHYTLKTEYLPFAMAGVVLTMIITFTFSRYEMRKGKELNSPSLQADAAHIRTDMLSSSVILAGLLGGWFGLKMDRVAAFLVVFLIFKAGMKIFIDALRVLLDASLDFETMDKVKDTILNDPQVISINALWGRNSGPFKFIEADIVVNAKDFEKAYAVSLRIEREIKENIKKVDHILIHYEPLKRETITYAVPLREDKETVSAHLGSAPYFYLCTSREKDGANLSESYKRNPFLDEEKGKGIKVSEWLLGKGVDILYSTKGFEGKGPSYVFSDAGVEIIVTEDASLSDIQNRISNKEHL